MSARSRFVLAITALAATACARPQAIVYLDTDAPSPRMIDRVRVDTLDAQSQPIVGETREFVVADRSEWPLSFGVAFDGQSSRRLRIRAFATGRVSADAPDPLVAIDRVVDVEPGAPIARYAVLLSLACAGVEADLVGATSCVSEAVRRAPVTVASRVESAPTESSVGQWKSSFRRSCASANRGAATSWDDEACVSGGAFWYGDFRRVGVGPVLSAVPEKPVAISPFFMDRREYTVGRYRAALRAGFNANGRAPQRRVMAPPGSSEAHIADEVNCPNCACTFIATDDASNDALPLNCVLHETAAALCQFEGRRLPTEAEWEWAAGAREQERFYVWGDERPACELFHGPTTTCSNDRLWRMPTRAGRYPGDTSLDGVFDLAGNVAEFTASDFQATTHRCWSYERSAENPNCSIVEGEMDYGTSVRGSNSMESQSLYVSVTARRPRTRDYASIGLGFRCARDDSP
ncbi:MAG: SUMF1/EgtB/PvdO family nonheme iron enzyme [Polyangiales bacterium]